jgi:glycerophosphoryl diester phosphodiesterase
MMAWRIGGLMRRVVFALLIAAAAIFAINDSRFAPADASPRVYLAHRGVHQQIDRSRPIGRDECTAGRIATPTHAFIENTLASIEAAFAAGASIVEIDIHPTTDGKFAIFHDWSLECRTNGEGVTRERDLAYLQSLDVGYGYTADGGRTFPLRGAGVGAMPSLDEVLAQFPTRRFLIHIKSNDPAEGEALARRLGQLPAAQRALLSVYGGDRPIARVAELSSDVKILSRGRIKQCMMQYFAFGWSGYMPKACHGAMLVIPVNYVQWVWGWPRRFDIRMKEAGAEVFIAGPLQDDASSGGVNTREDLSRIPAGWRGGVWTDAIETINPRAE